MQRCSQTKSLRMISQHRKSAWHRIGHSLMVLALSSQDGLLRLVESLCSYCLYKWPYYAVHCLDPHEDQVHTTGLQTFMDQCLCALGRDLCDIGVEVNMSGLERRGFTMDNNAFGLMGLRCRRCCRQ